MQGLSEKHYEELSVGSGISDEIIETVGYQTIEKRSRLRELGFTADQRRAPALLLPLHRPYGREPVEWQIKPDRPRKNKRGKVLKYEYRWARPPILDCIPHELMFDTLNEKRATIYITEGNKKAACAISRGIPCLSLAGVYGWRGQNEHGVKVVIPDIDEIDWQEREVRLCFDNDVMRKEEVYWALSRLTGILERRKAYVRYTLLPDGPLKGLDDFLVSGETPAALDRLTGTRIPDPPMVYYTHNDLGMANRVADFFNDELVYDNHNGLWFVWGEGVWYRDKPGNLAVRCLLDYTDVIREEARGQRDVKEENERKTPRQVHAGHAIAYGNSHSVMGAERIMRARLSETNPKFDMHPDLLNCPNGTLDLTTMEFSVHRPTDRLTCMTAARWPESAKEAECPKWLDFMVDRFPNVQTREFIQRMCGLFVTGNSPEKAFFIIQGVPDCGKTVFVEYLDWLLGGYANKVDKSTLTKVKGDNRQQEKAVELVGKRFVYVDESDQKDEVDAAFIKEVTGGDTTLKFRRLYEQVNEQKAQFTIVLATNFKPKITGNDAAVWRRCHLVEFGDAIPLDKQIGDFKAVLYDEGPGVLKWCVDGYLSWKKVGLEIPEEVRKWTQDYQEENDPLGRFMTACYDIGEHVDGYTTAEAVATHYQAWCTENDVSVKFFKESASLSRAIRARWPIVNEGPKGGGRGRRLFHMKALTDFRSTDGLDELLGC